VQRDADHKIYSFVFETAELNEQIKDIKEREERLEKEISESNNNLNTIFTYKKKFGNQLHDEFLAQWLMPQNLVKQTTEETFEIYCDKLKDKAVECVCNTFTNLIPKREEYIKNLEKQLTKDKKFIELEDEI